MRRLLAVASVLPLLLVLGSVAPGPAAGAGPAGPWEGLVLHYAFEQLSGGVVPDLSENSVDGRVVGSPVLAPSLSGYGRAIQLRGDLRQFVDVPIRPVLDVDRYTLSAWVRYTGGQNDRTFGRWEVLEKAGAYWMNVRTDGRVRIGGFYGGCANPAWQFLDSTRSVPVSRWKHLAATYDGSTLTVYLDGRPAGSKRVTGRTCVSGEPLAVGAKNNPTKGLLEAFWDGRLDDVRVYDRALSRAEVGQLAVRP